MTDYVIRDGQTNPAQLTFGAFTLNGVNFPKHSFVDPTTGSAIGVSGAPMFVAGADGALATVGAKADAAAAFGAGSASLVALLKAIATADAPFQGATVLTAGNVGTAGRALRVICTASGNITLTYADGSTDTVPVNTGLSYLPGAISRVDIPGSGGAAATFAIMK